MDLNFLIIIREMSVALLVVPIYWKYSMCLETAMINGHLLICKINPNVTIPYLLMILGGMSVIKLLSLGILLFLWTVFPSTTALAGLKMTLAISMCLYQSHIP